MGIILIYLVQSCQSSKQSTTSGLTSRLIWTSSPCSLSQMSLNDRRGLLCSAKPTGLSKPASLGHQPSTMRTHCPFHCRVTSGNWLKSLLRKWSFLLDLFLGFPRSVQKVRQTKKCSQVFRVILHKFKSSGHGNKRRRWGEWLCACAATYTKIKC